MSQLSLESSSKRFDAIDILRGLAIFGMGFSGMVPYTGLPAWMYHAQLPPPTRAFNDKVYGITWVDLVFPFFLFAMGAAIPLALTKRIDSGESKASIYKDILWRGFLIAAYALLGNQLRPYVISNQPGWSSFLLGFLGAVLLFGMMFRFPSKLPRAAVTFIRILSWIITIGAISLIVFPDGVKGFANYRSDIILLVLANVSVSGSLIWIWTRKNLGLRILVFFAVMVIFTTHENWNITGWIWDFTPMQFFTLTDWPHIFNFEHWKYNQLFPILYHFEYHKYLLITIPGLICGDLILKLREKSLPKLSVQNRRISSLTAFTLLPVCCIGLLGRWIAITFLLCVILAVILFFQLNLFEKIRSKMADSSLMDWFAILGIIFILGGFLTITQGGGIRKDEPTLSYFLLTSGLAFAFLLSVGLLAPEKKINLNLIRESGQNPIIGYIAITNLVPGIFGLTVIAPWLDSLPLNPWIDTLLALLKNIFVLYVAAYCTRRKWYLRA